MAEDYHVDFQRSLDNIRIKDLSAVCSRMSRILASFPYTTAPRFEEGIDNEGNRVENDLRGYRFDSRWDENVGSNICENVSGITLDFSRKIFDGLEMLANFIIKHRADIIANRTSTDYTNLKTFFDTNNLAKSSNLTWRNSADLMTNIAVSSRQYRTYCQLGFVLHQETLVNVDRGSKTDPTRFDVFDFCIEMSYRNLMNELTVIHGLTDANEFVTASNHTMKQVITVYAREVERLAILVGELALKMSHLIDGFSTCMQLGAHNLVPSKDPDVKYDDYTNDPSYNRIINTTTKKVELTKTTSTLRLVSELGTEPYRLAIRTRYPFRVESIKYGSTDIDFALTSYNATKNMTTGYAAYVTNEFNWDGSAGTTTEVEIKIGKPASVSATFTKNDVVVRAKRCLSYLDSYVERIYVRNTTP